MPTCLEADLTACASLRCSSEFIAEAADVHDWWRIVHIEGDHWISFAACPNLSCRTESWAANFNGWWRVVHIESNDRISFTADASLSCRIESWAADFNGWWRVVHIHNDGRISFSFRLSLAGKKPVVASLAGHVGDSVSLFVGGSSFFGRFDSCINSDTAGARAAR